MIDQLNENALADENVFRALAREARARSLPQLWLTSVGGGLDAALLWWHYPRLSWLAAGCATIAAYGLWGLLDRAAEDATDSVSAKIGGLRGVAAIVGTGTALWAVLGFMAAALGNWNH